MVTGSVICCPRSQHARHRHTWARAHAHMHCTHARTNEQTHARTHARGRAQHRTYARAHTHGAALASAPVSARSRLSVCPPPPSPRPSFLALPLSLSLVPIPPNPLPDPCRDADKGGREVGWNLETMDGRVKEWRRKGRDRDRDRDRDREKRDEQAFAPFSALGIRLGDSRRLRPRMLVHAPRGAGTGAGGQRPARTCDESGTFRCPSFRASPAKDSLAGREPAWVAGPA